MKDVQKIKEFFSKPLEENKDLIKVGDIVGNTVQGFNFKVKEVKKDTYVVQNTKTGKTIETDKDNMYKSGTKNYIFKLSTIFK